MGAAESLEPREAASAAPLGAATGKAVDATLLCNQLAHLSRPGDETPSRKSRSSCRSRRCPSDIGSQNCTRSYSDESDSTRSGSDKSDSGSDDDGPDVRDGPQQSPTVFEAGGDDLRNRAGFRVKFLSKLTQSGAWVPSEERPPKHQTLIIFDWDDTLLCTSFLLCMRAKYREDLAKDQQVILRDIARTAARLLEAASRLGRTFIITNAEAGWVESTAASFLPEIQPALQQVQVISARSRYEHEFPGQAGAWKEQAFLEIRRQIDAEIVANLISIGDSDFEMDALAIMGQEFAESCVKTVRFRQRPMPGQLLQELTLVLNKFERIVAGPRDLKLTLEAVAGPSR